MNSHQKSSLFHILSVRCRKQIADGNDGYISTQTLSFDVGLNVRTIRRELDEAVMRGEAERKYGGPGKQYSYRVREA